MSESGRILTWFLCKSNNWQLCLLIVVNYKLENFAFYIEFFKLFYAAILYITIPVVAGVACCEVTCVCCVF